MASRQLRKRKAAPVRHVPGILDDIFVLWELEGREMWWPACVVAIEKYDTPSNNFYGHGRLLYKRFRNYAEEESDVKFFFTPRRGHIIYQLDNNKELQMSWSKTASPDNERPIQQRKSNVEQPIAKVQPSQVNQLQPAPVNEVHPSQRAQPASNNLQERVASNMISKPSGTVESEEMSQMSTILSKSAGMFIEQLCRNTQTCVENLSRTAFNSQLASQILHELRIDLVSEMHRNFRAPPAGSVDLQQKCIRISLPCSLQKFSCLASSIRSSTDPSTVHFFPNYLQTQNPSVSTERLTVYFKSLHALASALGFNDNRDSATLYWREKCYDNVFYTRILGSLLPSSESRTAQTKKKKQHNNNV